MSNNILMSKGVASWLAKKTNLSLEQIANFCGIHEIEVSALRDGESKSNLADFDPVNSELLSLEEIARCEKDPSASLTSENIAIEGKKQRKNRSSAKKNEVPHSILWVINNYPDLSDSKIVKLLGCTKALVASIRDKSFKDYSSLQARHPVTLEFCTQSELDQVVSKLFK